MSALDRTIYEESLETSPASPPDFLRKEWLSILDENNGIYSSGQIQFSTSAAANSGRYISMREAYFIFPTIISLTCNTAAAQAAFDALRCPFAAGWKGSSLHLIDSFSCQLGNVDVLQLSRLQNVYAEFRVLTEMSEQDLKKEGPGIHFFKQTGTSFTFQNGEGTVGAAGTAQRRGAGVINNRNLPAMGTVQTWGGVPSYNSGFHQQQVQMNTDLDGNPFLTTANAATVGKPFYTQNDAAHTKYWFSLCRIPLARLHPFFAEIPLSRGLFFTFRLNMNLTTFTLNTQYNATAPTNNFYCSNAVVQGNTSPIMIASAEADQGMAGVITASGRNTDYTFKVSIAKDTATNVSHPTIQNCRLMVPVYQLADASSYISLMSGKSFTYSDLYSYQYDVASNQNIQVLVSNGIPDITGVLVVPIVRSGVNNVGLNGTPYYVSPLASPFTTEGATTSPSAVLTDFQVQIGGLNCFIKQTQYDFEQFVHETSKLGLNGSSIDGLSSGLISETDFQYAYRYYYADCSRMTCALSEQGVPKSVQILAKNVCSLDLTLLVYVIYNRRLAITVENGSIVS